MPTAYHKEPIPVVSFQKKIAEEIFGDCAIQLWQESNGGLVIKMYRGEPIVKVFCKGDFLLYADKVQKIAERLKP